MSRHGKHYEEDAERFHAEGYRAAGWDGIAWYVLGWETEPDEAENRTGRVVARMVGDDRDFTFEPDDLQPIEREEFCGECGQIGCGWC